MRARKPSKSFWRAYYALYSKDNSNSNGKVAGEQGSLNVGQISKPRKKRFYEEQQDQFRAHAWLTKKGIRHHHSPNGGFRNYVEAAKFKRMGTSAGYPDFHMPYMKQGFGGLFIELKRAAGGSLSPAQREWRDFLVEQGYAWFEAKGFEELKRIVCEYFSLPKDEGF